MNRGTCNIGSETDFWQNIKKFYHKMPELWANNTLPNL